MTEHSEVKSTSVGFEFKNKFLDAVINPWWDKYCKDSFNPNYGSKATSFPTVYSDSFFRGRILKDGKSSVTRGMEGGPCYGDLDARPGVDWDTGYVYCPPNRVGSDPAIGLNRPELGTNLQDREYYCLLNYFHPDSPWTPVVEQFTEMFEGYDTPEEKAALVARFGWLVGPTAFNNLTKVQLGAFLVYTRRQNTYQLASGGGIRESFKRFTQDERTRGLPLAWNMFCAHHVVTTLNGSLYQQYLDNGHNCFYPGMYPLTAAAFVTQKLELPKKELTWAATSGVGTWQSHNSDRLFLDLYQRQPKYAKMQYKPVNGETNNYRAPENELWSGGLAKDTVKLNLWYWENRVLPYV